MIVALVAGVGALLAQLGDCPPCVDQVPAGARVVETRTAGPDSAGTTVTLVAYFRRDMTFPSIELGQLGALAVRLSDAGVQTFQLGEDLGEYPNADLALQDLTGDGSVELAVFGYAGAHSALGHIYRWNGSRYDLVGEFFGDSGIGLVDEDGNSLAEVRVGARTYDRAQTRVDTAMVWNGSGFEPAWRRWSFTFDPDQYDYPESTVLGYYLAVAKRDYRAAYSLLGAGMRSSQSFDDFERGFATTRDLRVEDLELQRDDATSALVRVELSSIERDGTISRFGGTWQVAVVDGAWLLVGAYITPN